MSSSSKSGTQMSGVWATLNAMKARQASAASAVSKHKSDDSQRKSALSAFESAVALGGSPSQVFSRLAKDAAVRASVDSHKERIQTGRERGAVEEVKRVKDLAKSAAEDLAVVAEKVCRANETLHRMEKVGG